MLISVLIPTYRRVPDLARCLAGLEGQLRLPDEVVVVVRDTDTETLAYVQGTPFRVSVRPVPVQEPGQVQALNAGLDAVRGDVVMITDDDTLPRPDWVARVEAHFLADATLGGVGGRDLVHHGERVEHGECKVVGTVLWYGRVTGNHHLSAPGKAFVDVLKGANMSYRMAAVGHSRFDTRLRGKGAQVGNDMAFSFALRKKGWRLLYDPEVLLDHFEADRFDEDKRRVGFNPDVTRDMSFNAWWNLRRHLRPGIRRRMALGWELLVGAPKRPGWVRGVRSTLLRDGEGVAAARAAQRGRQEAEAAYRALGEA